MKITYKDCFSQDIIIVIKDKIVFTRFKKQYQLSDEFDSYSKRNRLAWLILQSQTITEEQDIKYWLTLNINTLGVENKKHLTKCFDTLLGTLEQEHNGLKKLEGHYNREMKKIVKKHETTEKEKRGN